MTAESLQMRFKELARTALPRPGSGATAERHRAIFAAGREDLSLAKLIEAHWDAVAILEEADLAPLAEATYAVWASEMAGKPLTFADNMLSGVKHFCSGSTLVDRALVTAGRLLVEVDLRFNSSSISMDGSGWRTDAFRETATAVVTFSASHVERIVGADNWYTQRSGFWAGACGPAAAWAGGAAALLDYATGSKRDDPHTLAHLGAMYADVTAMEKILAEAGQRFDKKESDELTEALAVRHTVEQLCSDVLRRFSRALGPAPLALNANIARRFAELELYLRQNHAERDLEALGRHVQRRFDAEVGDCNKSS